MVKLEFYAVELVFINREPHYRFFGRDIDNNKVDFILKAKDFYFYILESEVDKIDFPCHKEFGFKSLYGDKTVKIIVDNYFDINGTKKQEGLIKKFTKTFEADISAPTRFLIDNQIYTTLELANGTIKPTDCTCTPRVCNIDIETRYSHGSNSDMMLPIIAISFYDNYDKKFYTFAYNEQGTTRDRQFQIESVALFDDKEHLVKRKLDVIEKIVKNEEELLQSFLSYVKEKDPDVFAGWNVKFDMIYILHRLKILNLDYESISPIRKVYYNNGTTDFSQAKTEVQKKKSNFKRDKKVTIRGRSVIDILAGFRRIKWKQLASFRLDAVANSEFGIAKVAYKGTMESFWKNDFETFLQYNLRDVELCLAIDEKYSVIESLLNIRKISGAELSDVLHNSRLFDVYILRYCRNKFVLPTKTYSVEEHEKVEGGFVLDPVVGIHKNVIVLDLKSLYPSIMLSFNMSPETVDVNGDISIGNGIRFRKEIGILKEILVDLINRRDTLRAELKRPEVKNDKNLYTNIYKRQYYYKTFTNSAYGINLYPGFRLYNPAIGSSITFVGRFLAGKIKEYCEGLGYRVIYQDTDSAFITTKENDPVKVVEIGKVLEDGINHMFSTWFAGMNNDVSYFSIKFEKLYGVLYKGGEKKMYAGKITWDWEQKGFLAEPETEIKGFASVKTDRSQFSRHLQKTVLEMILAGTDSNSIMIFIYSEIQKFYKNEYKYEYIAIPKAITNDIDAYKISNPWIDGVKWSMQNLDSFQMSVKPFLLYVKPTKEINTEVICFNNESELPKDLKLDYKKMLEACAYKIVQNILPMINEDADKIKSYISLTVNNQRTLF